MTHAIFSSVLLITLALVAAWALLRLLNYDHKADRMTRGLGLVGIALLLALAANESYRLVELVNAQPATMVMEVPSCAK